MKIEILSSNSLIDNNWFLDQLDFNPPRSLEMSFSRKKDMTVQHIIYVFYNVNVKECCFKCAPFFGNIDKFEIVENEQEKKWCYVYLPENHRLEFSFEGGIRVWKT